MWSRVVEGQITELDLYSDETWSQEWLISVEMNENSDSIWPLQTNSLAGGSLFINLLDEICQI